MCRTHPREDAGPLHTFSTQHRAAQALPLMIDQPTGNSFTCSRRHLTVESQPVRLQATPPMRHCCIWMQLCVLLGSR